MKMIKLFDDVISAAMSTIVLLIVASPIAKMHEPIVSSDTYVPPIIALTFVSMYILIATWRSERGVYCNE